MKKYANGRRHARVVVAGAAAAGLLLTGCSASAGGDGTAAASCEPSAEPVELQYWNWVPGMEEVIAVWNKENPDIHVSMKNISNNSNAQIQNALKADQAPDLAQIGFDTLASYRSQGSLLDVAACEEAIAAEDAYLDWTWAQTSFNGEGVFAIPQDIGPMALFYRADLFEQYGFDVPKTWDDYLAVARALPAVDPNAKMTYFDGENSGWVNGLVWQRGGTPFSYDDDKWQVSIDSPQAQEVAGVWQQLVDEDLVRTDLTGGSAPLFNAFSEGQLVSYVGAAWGYSLLRDNVPDQAGKWRVAPLPSWTEGEVSGSNWGGSAVAFMEGSEHPYEAVKFNHWLNSDPEAIAMLNELGGLYPAAVAGQDLPSFQNGVEYYGDQKIYEVFNEVAENVDSTWQSGPTQVDADLAQSDAMVKAAGGDGQLADAFAIAQAAAIKAMQAQSIPVETD